MLFGLGHVGGGVLCVLGGLDVVKDSVVEFVVGYLGMFGGSPQAACATRQP